MQRLVLMGATQGPWCGISEVKNPVLTVSGLKTGIVDGEIRDVEGGHYTFSVATDGVFPLTEGSIIPVPAKRLAWIRLRTSLKLPKILCIVSTKVD